MLSCILFRESFDSLKVDYIRKSKGFIDFSFFFFFFLSSKLGWMGKI